MTDHKQEFVEVLTAKGLYSQIPQKGTRKKMIEELAQSLVDVGFRRMSYPDYVFEVGDKVRLTGADWNPALKGKVVEVTVVDPIEGPIIDGGASGEWIIFRSDVCDYSAEKA